MTNRMQEVFDILWSNQDNPNKGVEEVIEKGGDTLKSAVALGGMLLMIMAENNYTDPQQVWDTVAAYEDA